MKKSISTDLTPTNIAAVLSILKQTPAHLAQLSEGLTTEQLRQPLGDGERSFIENLAHLIHCEARDAETIVAALTLHEPLILSIHPERQLGKLLHLEKFAFAELLTYFTLRRGILLRVLDDLTPEQWARVVRAEGKQRKESVYWQARGLAMHEAEHLDDLEKKLRGVAGE